MTVLFHQAMAALRTASPNGFFVGGCVRDWLLGRPLKDLDVVGPDPVRSTGRDLADALGGAFFWLREEMGVGRVILKSEPLLQIDLVPLTSSLADDLRRRDFTVNAMAVSVREGLVAGASIIDPTGGRGDLERRLLRLAAPDALVRDPLRCLRAFRLRSRLGLTFASGLEADLAAAAPLLSRVSGERIRDELFVLLEADQGAPVVAELLRQNLVQPWSAALAASATGSPPPAIGAIAAPESSEAAPASLAPSGLELLETLDRWLLSPPLPPGRAADLNAALGASVTAPRSRLALARLAALSISAGASTGRIGRSLCLSEDEIRVHARSVGGATALAATTPAAGRDRLCFFRRWEPGAVEAALLALAAKSAAQAPSEERARRGSPLADLLEDTLERRLRPAPPLLTGEEVMTLCRIAPGPAVGQWLRAVEEQRADRRLRTVEEARAWLQAQCAPGVQRGEP